MNLRLMKWIKKQKVLMMFAMMNIFSLAVNACGGYGYGTISSYLFGTVLQPYSVWVNADVRVQEISQKNYVTTSGTYYFPSVFNPSCSVAQGNNLTMLAYNITVTQCYPIGNSGNYAVDCMATWTVGYRAHLKASGSLNGKYRNPDAKTPMSGGVDFTFAYDYESSASGYLAFYCSAMGSGLAGH